MTGRANLIIEGCTKRTSTKTIEIIDYKITEKETNTDKYNTQKEINHLKHY